MKSFIMDCITGIDGVSIDVGRVLWIFGALGFFGMSIYACWRTGLFDPISYGGGLGGILAGGGAGIGLKSNTEPKPPIPAKGE